MSRVTIADSFDELVREKIRKPEKCIDTVIGVMMFSSWTLLTRVLTRYASELSSPEMEDIIMSTVAIITLLLGLYIFSTIFTKLIVPKFFGITTSMFFLVLYIYLMEYFNFR